MRWNRTALVMLASGFACSLAGAQYDPAAHWPGYRADGDRRASVQTADGPAVDVAWTNNSLQPGSLGGFSVDGAGFIYFKTRSSQAVVVQEASGLQNGDFNGIGPWGPSGGTVPHADFAAPPVDLPPVNGDPADPFNAVRGDNFGFMSVQNDEIVGQTLGNAWSEGEEVTFSSWAMWGGDGTFDPDNPDGPGGETSTNYDAGGFDAFTPGSLEGAPQDGWEGFDLGGDSTPPTGPGAIAPAITGGGQGLALEVSPLPADNDVRQESRVVFTLPDPISIANTTEINITMTVTFDADGDTSRHNFYFDFDAGPDQFGTQLSRDDGLVGMVTGGVTSPGTAANGQIVMQWIFNTELGVVNTFYNGIQIDTDALVSLSDLTGGPDFTTFSMGLVKDFRTASFGDTVVIDDFVIEVTEVGVAANPVDPVIYEIGYEDTNGDFQLLASETYDTTGTWTEFAGVSHTPAPGAPEIGQPVVVRFGGGDSALAPYDIWIDAATVTPFASLPEISTGFNQVFKLDPADGSVVATSPQLLGNAGDYSGVALGTQGVFTVTSGNNTNGERESTVWTLDPSDLSVIQSFTDQAAFDQTEPASAGLRGLGIGSNGNVYLHERGNGSDYAVEIHAYNPTTNSLEWSYQPIFTTQTFFGSLGPIFPDAVSGNDLIAYFSRDSLFSGTLVEDNGNGTFSERWFTGFAGPNSFNWYGSGSLSADGETIFVTTFNDGPVADPMGGNGAIWAIDVATGSILDFAPGFRGFVNERNFFGRPAVLGNVVYAGAQNGGIYRYDWDPTLDTLTETWRVGPLPIDDDGDDLPDIFPGDPAAWETPEDFQNAGEFTALSVAEVTGGPNPGVYVYGMMQEEPGTSPLTGQLIVIKDDGTPTPQVVLRTNLDGTLPNTRFGNGNPTPLADGSLLISGGSVSTTGAANGLIAKLVVCIGDYNRDGVVDADDVNDFLADNPTLDFLQILAFLGNAEDGCPL